MQELVRRIICTLCLVAAIILYFHQATELIKITPIDFAKRRADAWGFSRQQSLEAYIASKTKDMLFISQDKSWLDFYLNNQDNSVYFTGDEPLLKNYRWPLNRDYHYLAIDDGTKRYYLSLSKQKGSDAYGAPKSLLHPYRMVAIYFLIAGILAYFMIPRIKPPKGAYYCKPRFSSVYMPDVLAFFLITVFTWLAVMLNNEFDGEAVIIWAGFGFLFVGISAIILWFSAYYAALWMLLSEDRLTLANLKGRFELVFSEVETVEDYNYRPPKWLIVVANIIFLLTLGQGNLPRTILAWNAKNTLSSGEMPGVHVIMKNGDKFYLSGQVENFDKIVKELRKWC